MMQERKTTPDHLTDDQKLVCELTSRAAQQAMSSIGEEYGWSSAVIVAVLGPGPVAVAGIAPQIALKANTPQQVLPMVIEAKRSMIVRRLALLGEGLNNLVTQGAEEIGVSHDEMLRLVDRAMADKSVIGGEYAIVFES